MDLIGDDPVLKINDKSFRVYSRNLARPPQYLGTGSSVRSSLVSEGCKIYGTVVNSVLSGGVVVKEGAVVMDSVIMEDVVIYENASVYSSIVDQNSVIFSDATIGKKSGGKNSITVIAKGSKISSDVSVNN